MTVLAATAPGVQSRGGGVVVALPVIEASHHRFRDNQPELQCRLKEAIAWIVSALVAGGYTRIFR